MCSFKMIVPFFSYKFYETQFVYTTPCHAPRC
uniref:Uncharacterized protein n=1 Tax=Anguilla anguilla TaxID=7936 RepID=A0A0E9QSJ2_ANGAN